jgi:PAS domain S-box-containing protein
VSGRAPSAPVGRVIVAAAGLAHAIARLSGSQQVCVVAESPEETLATVAGLIRAADLGRDRFALLMPGAATAVLAQVLAAAGIDLPAALAAGQIAQAADAPGAPGSAALLRACIDTLAQPRGRCFAVVDISHCCAGADPREALALHVALGEAAEQTGSVVLALHDRSLLAPGVVHDAVSSHRLVLAHGVLGENLRSVAPAELIARRESPLDVDRLLHSLHEPPRPGPAGELSPEDAASRRLSAANEQLQREIAERVRIELTLSASEERYRLLVEALPDCVFVHSAGAIVFVNRAGVQMVRGDGPAAVLGRSVMSFVHPESLPTVGARVRMMLEQGLRAPMMVERFVRLDGTDFYAEAVATPLLFEGRPAIQVVMRDITERRAAEAELQFTSFLADNVIDGILVRRLADGVILYVNAAMCALTGMRREQLVGSRHRDFIPAPELPAVERELRAIASRGQGIFETFFVCAPGAPFPVEIHAVVVRHGEQQVLVSIIRDISERKRAEAQQRDLSEQLQRAQKMEAIGTLASGIAHDFNNILAGILGYAELIQHRTREGEPFHKAATVIGKAAERGAGLAQKILMVARKENLDRQCVDLNGLVRSAAELLRKSLPSSVELELRLAPGLPLLLADPAQIDQIVMNLAVNARDAMPEGGRLTLETALGADGDGGLCFSVSDTGVGMDEETQRRVYDPFFTTKSTGRGTGLGLYIVHTAVSNHGGHIQLSSRPGRGTRIAVCLPVAPGVAAGARPLPVDPRGIGTILVVDDEPLVREMCSDLLGSLGYTVLTASDGEEGVARYRDAQERIDLVLLDMVLPKLSGPAVFEQLRLIRADARVILCSGFNPSGHTGIDALIAAGALGFVQKPFTIQAIGTAITAALSGAPAAG